MLLRVETAWAWGISQAELSGPVLSLRAAAGETTIRILEHRLQVRNERPHVKAISYFFDMFL